LGHLAAVSWYLHLLFACLCSIASPFKPPPPDLDAELESSILQAPQQRVQALLDRLGGTQ
jgi:hypothetical protein